MSQTQLMKDDENKGPSNSEPAKKQKKGKKHKSKYNEESSEEESEDDAQDEYEKKSGVRKPKKDEGLEADEIELIKENLKNLGKDVEETIPSISKLKRLKKGNEKDTAEAPKVKNVTQLQEALFGDDAGELDKERDEEKDKSAKDKDANQEIEESPSASEEEGEMADFIVEGGVTKDKDWRDADYDEQNRKSGGRDKRHHSRLASVTTRQLRIAEEIFGEVPSKAQEGQNEDIQMKDIDNSKKIAKIEDYYEPNEIKRRYATEYDYRIKNTDLPERWQLIFGDRPNPSPEELLLEADWIWKQRKQKDQKELIKNVLEAYRNEHYEAPFVYTYRKFIYKQQFDPKDIWNIYNYDERWYYFSEMRNKIAQRLAPMLDDWKQFSFIKDEFQKSETQEELEDMQEFVAFYLTVLKVGKDSANAVNLTRKQIHLNKLIQAKIPEIAEKIMLRPWEFAENIKSMQLIHAPPDMKVRARLLAKDYISQKTKDFLGEEQIFIAIIDFTAEQISVLPSLRKITREYFMNNATLSTAPTTKGSNELDVFNLSYRVKHIIKRPLGTMQDDLYLDILSHERKGFITVKIGLEQERIEELIKKYRMCFIQEEETTDEIAKEYNTLRKESINKAFKTFLLPSAEQYARKELERRSEEYIIQRCSDHFRKLLNAGPYKLTEREGEGNEENIEKQDRGIKILSFVIDMEAERKGVIQIAVVDKNGELLESKLIHTNIIKKPDNLTYADKIIYEQDAEECKKFIRNHQPDLIVVGANNIAAQTLKKLLREWALNEQRIVENDVEMQVLSLIGDSEKINSKKKEAWVTWGDLSVPKIYSISEAASRQFPEFTPLLRMAISQARYKQDPLSEILNLWSQEDNSNGVFSINLHHLQKLVRPKALRTALEQVAIEIVNEAGIDINRIVDHQHLTETLSFLCGFGPRKAQELLMAIQKKGKLNMRIQLLGKHMVGQVLYKNCVGFLKICKEGGFGDDPHDLRDQTRLHPENYFLAIKIASEALADDKGIANSKDEAIILEKIMKNPKKLNNLDLRQYAEQLDKANQGNTKLLVEFVVQELSTPFKDPRPKYKDLVDEDLFYLLIAETPQTFYKGMIVSATVLKATEGSVRCKLENGMDAFIKKSDILDDQSEDDIDLSKKFAENTVLPARIKLISFADSKFIVNLTARKQDLKSHESWISNLPSEDRAWFSIDPIDLENKKMVAEERKQMVKYMPRRIAHKNFKNISLLKTTEYLSSKDIGEFVFRPSSKGPDHITITIKFYHNVYSHTDIIEEQKQPGAIIGSKLLIGNEYYDSLDEIVARYVTPIVDYAKETSTYRKFFEATSTKAIEEKVLQEQTKNPNIISYCITILPEYPQFVVLAYCPKSDKVVKEYIKVKPQGYYFHESFHKNMQTLIGWFKQHFTDTDYKHFLKKCNKPPALIIQKREEPITAASQAEQWKDIPEEWRGASKTNDETSNASGRFSRGDRESGGSRGRGRGGGGPRGRGRGRRPMTCFKCNQEGHMSKDCPNPPQEGRGSTGEQWNSSAKPDSSGWNPQNTSQESWGGSAEETAKNNGIQPEEKKDQNDASNTWGSKAEENKDASAFNTVDNQMPSGTFEERRPEREARRGRGRGCFNCGETGHLAKDCPTKPSGNTRGGGRNCFKCGKPGHMARECTESGPSNNERQRSRSKEKANEPVGWD